MLARHRWRRSVGVPKDRRGPVGDGDRQANTALWMIPHVRLVHDDRTKAYAAKRTALGNDRKEIMRRLKRYIVREVYPIIIEAPVDVEARHLT